MKNLYLSIIFVIFFLNSSYTQDTIFKIKDFTSNLLELEFYKSSNDSLLFKKRLVFDSLQNYFIFGTDSIFLEVNQKARFISQEGDSIESIIKKNVHHPEPPAANNAVCELLFIIDKNGKVLGMGIDTLTTNYVYIKQVIDILPRFFNGWSPALKNGQAVGSIYFFQIRFYIILK